MTTITAPLSRVTWDPAPALKAAEARGWSDHEFADVIDVAWSTVSSWRQSRRRMTDVTADRAATALGWHPVLLWPEWHDMAPRWCDCAGSCDCDPMAVPDGHRLTPAAAAKRLARNARKAATR